MPYVAHKPNKRVIHSYTEKILARGLTGESENGATERAHYKIVMGCAYSEWLKWKRRATKSPECAHCAEEGTILQKIFEFKETKKSRTLAFGTDRPLKTAEARCAFLRKKNISWKIFQF